MTRNNMIVLCAVFFVFAAWLFIHDNVCKCREQIQIKEAELQITEQAIQDLNYQVDSLKSLTHYTND